MTRPHIEFIEWSDVQSRKTPDGPLQGVPRRVLSAEENPAEHTGLYHFPHGWSGTVSDARPLEMFGLRGSLQIAGQSLSPGCYAYVPTGAQGAEVRVIEDCDLLLMANAERVPQPDQQIQVIDQRSIAWHSLGENPDRAPGIVIKLLREDPGTGDWTWVSAVVPGWLSHRAEVHPTVEEAFMLRGDILLGARGVMHAGSYFWRPGMVEHGPMYSRDGAMFFFRTKGGALSTTWVAVSGWEETVRRYASDTPFYNPWRETVP